MLDLFVTPATKIQSWKSLYVLQAAGMLLRVGLLLTFVSTSYSQGKPSGITGQVLLFGHAGPETAEESRHKPPYHGLLAVKRTSDGQILTVVPTDHEGRFTVRLAPGSYLINGFSQVPGSPRIDSGNIRVEENKFTHVKLWADNGMR